MRIKGFWTFLYMVFQFQCQKSARAVKRKAINVCWRFNKSKPMGIHGLHASSSDS